MKNQIYILILLISCISCSKNKPQRIDNPSIRLIPIQSSQSKKWGYVDKDKNWIIDPQYSDAWVFEHGAASASIDGTNYGIINIKGEWLIEPKYEVTGPFGSSFFSVGEKGKNIQIVDLNEKPIITGAYTNIFLTDFDNGLLALYSANIFDDKVLAGYKNKNDEWVIQPKYKFLTDFKEGYAAVAEYDGPRQIIDTLGNVVVSFPDSIDYSHSYSDGLMVVRSNNKYGYANLKGELVIDYLFDDAENFYKGIACVTKNDTLSIIDKNGNILYKLPEYSAIGDFKDNLLLVSTKKEPYLYGFIDRNGQTTIPLIYKNTSIIEDDLLRVTDSENKTYYIDLKTMEKYID